MDDSARPPDAELKAAADEICRLIADTDYPAVDVAIKAAQLRRWCEENLPDKTSLFDMIYLSRFKRLWRRFRPDEAPPAL